MRILYWLSLWLRRLVVAALVFVLILAMPVVYVETACRGSAGGASEPPLLPEESRRDESRTFTTYPEWHIVHAYDDYARVIEGGDPHDFSYVSAVTGFWGSLCPLAAKAAQHGGFTADSKMTIYTIGASFTGEMLLKGLYEETLGRIATLVRGDARAPLDDVSAQQAADYAAFLQQTPWYRWDFGSDARALVDGNSGTPRDWERAVALNIEYRAKAAYAKAIGAAVAATGNDELVLRSVVSGLSPQALQGIEGVTVIGPRGSGIEIETPRYRAFTRIALALIEAGGDFVEIAGNDDILVTGLSDRDTAPGALYSVRRQGSDGYRHLIDLKVWAMAERLRQLRDQGVEIEHIHDY